MEITDKEYEIFKDKKEYEDSDNSYTIISKSEDISTEDFGKMIKIIDQKTGQEISCTYSKFLEILDSSGLESFI